MKKDDKKSDFLELLRINNNLELKNWLISKGKSGKAFCPVMFNNKKEEKGDEKQ